MVCIPVLLRLSLSWPPQRTLSAHHGNAAYDATKEVTLAGVVTEWIVANPHSLLKFDATDDKGNVSSIGSSRKRCSKCRRQGVRLTKQLLKPGDKVTVTMMVAKNGQPVGRIHRLVAPRRSIDG